MAGKNVQTVSPYFLPTAREGNIFIRVSHSVYREGREADLPSKGRPPPPLEAPSGGSPPGQRPPTLSLDRDPLDRDPSGRNVGPDMK